MHPFTAPADLESQAILHQAELEPAPEAEVGTVLGPPATTRGAAGLVVSIGRPESWPLAELYRAAGRRLPAAVAVLAQEARFCLARLAFSVHPSRELRVELVRFSVNLHGPGDERGPVAFDLHPQSVTSQRDVNLKVALTPSLKFSQFETDLASAEVGVAYSRLEPVVIGAGVGEAQVEWTFKRTAAHPVVGSRFTYLLVRCPPALTSVRATFELEADVTKAGQLLRPLRTRAADAAHRTAVLCAG